MVKFRFEDLEIWKDAIELTDKLFDLADELEAKKKFRFSEQLRGAALSMTNNIAEGSGSYSKKEFSNFLNISRRSTFENANMIILFRRRNLVDESEKDNILKSLDLLCRKISNFMRALA